MLGLVLKRRLARWESGAREYLEETLPLVEQFRGLGLPLPPGLGEETRLVLSQVLAHVAGRFAEGDPGAGPAASARRRRRESDDVEQPASPDEVAKVIHVDAPAPPDDHAPTPDASVESIVGAVLNALKQRVGVSPDLPTVAPATDTTQVPDSTAELLAHLDASPALAARVGVRFLRTNRRALVIPHAARIIVAA